MVGQLWPLACKVIFSTEAFHSIKNKLSCFLRQSYAFLDPAYLVVLCEEELVVIDLVTKEAG